MTIIDKIKEQLNAGYSKAELEYLIGIPKNNLASILSGKRKLSKKSELKVDRFLVSEKPDPLSIIIKTTDAIKPNEIIEPTRASFFDKLNQPFDNTPKVESKMARELREAREKILNNKK